MWKKDMFFDVSFKTKLLKLVDDDVELCYEFFRYFFLTVVFVISIRTLQKLLQPNVDKHLTVNNLNFIKSLVIDTFLYFKIKCKSKFLSVLQSFALHSPQFRRSFEP